MKSFFLVFVIVAFISCKKEKDYKLSDDICTVCSQNPIHVIGDDTLRIPSVFTPNRDGINDHFIISGLEKFSNNTIEFYDRNMNQLAQYSPYLNDWSGGSVNDQTSVKPKNGLYHYKLTIGTSSFEGSILILTQKDDYFDISIHDNACGSKCSLSFSTDPILYDE